ncbi:TPA: hypothetical protein N0F65_008753 [Lagenidium giganteum]|uniref:AB hydrolase-1 domain-containing protein n=1 Tax=Lagenidium giganteum TaxID=4803 RepID=A0AAV2YZW0_9STRA|nr:TPA: hypothetical protein N0F65_008753 [Lagenidium giganteum]
MNGWYACGSSTTSTNSYMNDEHFECAEFEVPLCHDGVCTSDKTIAVFVKRLAAKAPTAHHKPRKALYLLQGGPGYSSEAMEYSMLTYSRLSDGAIDLYTVDHRGTGRSNFLECKAAQAFNSGSPDGKEVTLEEMPECLKDVLFHIDDHTEAFSVTSAAKDLALVINALHPDPKKSHVFVGGASYGTFLVQRLMHFAPPAVRGYVLDGVDTEMPANSTSPSDVCHWNHAILEPSKVLLQYCYDDPSCPLKFDGERDDVLDEVMRLYAKLDNNAEKNACAKWLLKSGSESEETPSDVLRGILAGWVGDVSARERVPLFLSLLKRCTKHDLREAKRYVSSSHWRRLTSARPAPRATRRLVDILNPVEDESPILFNLITFSERWESSDMSLNAQQRMFRAGPFSTPWTTEMEMYCLYTSNSDENCRDFDVPTGPHFVYDKDKYYGAPLHLADNQSVLLVNGKLDFNTPSAFAKACYDKIEGGD